jgi:hypothetical protein
VAEPTDATITSVIVFWVLHVAATAFGTMKWMTEQQQLCQAVVLLSETGANPALYQQQLSLNVLQPVRKRVLVWSAGLNPSIVLTVHSI